MNFLFIFLDGVGLGSNNPEINPLAHANMPVMQRLLDGNRLVVDTTPFTHNNVSLLALDACLNVDGMPQSATGQAAILTGLNVPYMLGYHYGPKPNEAIAELVQKKNVFSILHDSGKKTALLNAYPQRYFSAINSGKRLYSSIPLAVTSAGINLKTTSDLRNGHALSADFTSQGWRSYLGIKDVPLLSEIEAGKQLARIAQKYDFSFFDYWLSDYAGHSQNFDQACQLLETFDSVLGGILQNWDNKSGLIFITSDHGNMEDLSTRRHTFNPVPGLLIGPENFRMKFTSNLQDLTDITPQILSYFNL